MTHDMPAKRHQQTPLPRRKVRFAVAAFAFLLAGTILATSAWSGSSNLVFDHSDIGVTRACAYYRLEYSGTPLAWASDMTTLKTDRLVQVHGNFTELKDATEAWEWEVNTSTTVPVQDCTKIPWDRSTWFKDNSSWSNRTEYNISCSWKNMTVYAMSWARNTGKDLNANGNALYSFASKKGHMNVRFCSDISPVRVDGKWEISLDHVPSFASVTYNKMTWWNASWGYSRIINITAASAIPARYTANFTWDMTNENVLITGNDTRVVCNDAEVDRNITKLGSSTALVEFMVPGAIAAGAYNDTCSVYYGNPSAGNPMNNRSNIYDAWQDFEDCTAGSAPAGWSLTPGEGSLICLPDQKYQGSKSLYWTGATGVTTHSSAAYFAVNTTWKNYSTFFWAYHNYTWVENTNGHFGMATKLNNTVTFYGDKCTIADSGVVYCYACSGDGDCNSNGADPVAMNLRTANRWDRWGADIFDNALLGNYSINGTKITNWDNARNTGGTQTSGFAGAYRPTPAFIDNFIRVLTVPANPSVTLGGETINQGIIVTTPANSTFVRSWTPLTFTVTGNDAAYTCWRLLDGTETTIGTVANDTANTTNITGLSHASHNLEVKCLTGSGNISSANRIFTSLHYQVNQTSGRAAEYETNGTEIRSTVAYAPDLIRNVTASIKWNGTDQGCTNTSAAGMTTHSASVTVPLLAANNTSINWNFNYTLGWVNGSMIPLTGAGNAQILMYAYILASVSSPSSSWIAGQNITVNATVTHFLDNSDTNVSIGAAGNIIRNVSGHAATAQSHVYGTNMIMVNTNGTFSYNGTATFSFQGKSRSSSSSGTFNVFTPEIGDCAGNRATSSFWFFHYNEGNLSAVNSTIIGVTLHAGGAGSAKLWNYSANFTGYDLLHRMCLYPATGDFYADIELDFGGANSSWTQRSYFIWNKSITNASANYSLYNIDPAVDDIITFTVQDISGLNKPNLVIEAERYYPSQDIYRSAAMGRTGPDGKVPMSLERYNAWYRFTIRNPDGSIIRTFDKMVLSATTITLRTTSETFSKYLQTYDQFTSACLIQNSSGSINYHCEASDTTGADRTWTFEIWNRTVNTTGGWNLACGSVANGPSASFNCDLGNVTDRGFYARLWVDVGGTPVLLHARQFDYYSGWAVTLGIFGVFIAAAIILAMGMLGLFNPAAGIVMQIGGIIAMVGMGFITLEQSALLWIIIAGSIIVYWLRT